METGQSKTGPAKAAQTSLSVIDPSFDSQDGFNYHLAFYASIDRISYSVLDLAKNTYVGLEDYRSIRKDSLDDLALNLNEVFASSELLKCEFKSVSLALQADDQTLVPNALIDTNRLDAYVNLLYGKAERELELDAIPTLEAANIYSAAKSFTNTFVKQFPKSTLKHATSVLLESLLIANKNSMGQRVYLHIQSRHIDIVVLNGRKLEFYNSFAHQTDEDIIYYLLFVMEQLELNTENIPVHVYGFIQKSSKAYALLRRYVRKALAGKRPDSYKYPQSLDEIPGHYYYNLFSQYTCV